MGRIMDTVVEHFDVAGLHYELVPDEDVLKSGLCGDNGAFPLRFITNEEDDVLILIMSAEARIPAKRRSSICEFLTRLNWDLPFGSFQMDLSDGEVIYQSAIDVEDGVLSTTMVGNMVSDAIGAVDKNFPGLMAVTFAGILPADAIVDDTDLLMVQ